MFRSNSKAPAAGSCSTPRTACRPSHRAIPGAARLVVTQSDVIVDRPTGVSGIHVASQTPLTWFSSIQAHERVSTSRLALGLRPLKTPSGPG